MVDVLLDSTVQISFWVRLGDRVRVGMGRRRLSSKRSVGEAVVVRDDCCRNIRKNVGDVATLSVGMSAATTIRFGDMASVSDVVAPSGRMRRKVFERITPVDTLSKNVMLLAEDAVIVKDWKRYTIPADSTRLGLYVAWNVLPGALDDSRIDGYLFDYQWQEIESAPGIYNWSTIDNDIVAFALKGKKITAAIRSGDFTPYFVANVNLGNAVRIVYGSHDTKYGNAHYAEIPLPWDERYLSAWEALIAAFSAHLDTLVVTGPDGRPMSGRDVIDKVRLTGITQDTEETRMPRQDPNASRNRTAITSLNHAVHGVVWAKGASVITSTTNSFLPTDDGALIRAPSNKSGGFGMPGLTYAKYLDSASVALYANATWASVTQSYMFTNPVLTTAKKDFVENEWWTTLSLDVPATRTLPLRSTDAQAALAAAGYKPSLVMGAWRRIVAAWITHFGDKVITQPCIFTGGFPQIDESSRVLAVSLSPKWQLDGDGKAGSLTQSQDLIDYAVSECVNASVVYMGMRNGLECANDTGYQEFADLVHGLGGIVGFQCEMQWFEQGRGQPTGIDPHTGLPYGAWPSDWNFYDTIAAGLGFGMTYFEIGKSSPAAYPMGMAYGHEQLSPRPAQTGQG